MAETDLYLPLKSFMESAGYAVKGEINDCDLVGVLEGDPPVVIVCEMKLAFNLELVMQGVKRAAFCDEVWLAARAAKTGRGASTMRASAISSGVSVLGCSPSPPPAMWK